MWQEGKCFENFFFLLFRNRHGGYFGQKIVTHNGFKWQNYARKCLSLLELKTPLGKYLPRSLQSEEYPLVWGSVSVKDTTSIQAFFLFKFVFYWRSLSIQGSTGCLMSEGGGLLLSSSRSPSLYHKSLFSPNASSHWECSPSSWELAASAPSCLRWTLDFAEEKCPKPFSIFAGQLGVNVSHRCHSLGRGEGSVWVNGNHPVSKGLL